MLSGQYTIQSDDTVEQAISNESPAGRVVRIKNVGTDSIMVGDNSLDGTNGFNLDSGDSVPVRLIDISRGGESSLYVFGTSGDKIEWIVIA